MAFLATPDSVVTAAAPRAISTTALRVLLVTTVALAGAVGVWATESGSAQAIAAAGDDLANLLRMMAGLKAMMAAALVGAALWRLGVPISPVRYAGYSLACAAMSAGTAMIWTMTHVGTGALLLHGGLLLGVLCLWFDPAVGARLSTLVAARRRVAR